jgi:hypothetical protein
LGVIVRSKSLLPILLAAVAAIGLTAVAAPVSAAAPVFNVKTYGATANDSTNDTPAINKAIAAANQAGGGIVEVPSGTFTAGSSIHMMSNVTIQLDAGSVVKGTATGYDKREANPNDQYQDQGHSYFHDAMIWGDRLTNIAFVGSGTLDGGGNFITGNPKDGQADKIVSLTRCNGLTISGITLKRGGHFGMLTNGCTNITSDHLTIDTADNRDGWNVINATNVTITNITVHANDDALVFKSDWALGQTLNNGNVSVTNANLSAVCCNALMFGSETCGNFTHYRFNHITITGAHKSGLGIVSVDGAKISDVVYNDVTMSGTWSPILLRVESRLRCGGTPTTGSISDIHYINVTGTAAGKFSPTIWGQPGHRVSNVTFDNVKLTLPGGHAAMDPYAIPSNDGHYDPANISDRPAYGWYMHEASNIHFTNSAVTLDKADARPAIVVNPGDNITFDHMTAQIGSGQPFDAGFKDTAGYCVTNSTTATGKAWRINTNNSTKSCPVAGDSLLSQGRPVLASSEGGSGYVATNAVDGNSATRWASISHVDPQWIRVDLGATKAISKVSLQWDLSCATAYQVQTSNDASTWTTAYTTTTGKGGTEDLALTASGRYVRMYGTARCRDAGYSLQEFRVYGH